MVGGKTRQYFLNKSYHYLENPRMSKISYFPKVYPDIIFHTLRNTHTDSQNNLTQLVFRLFFIPMQTYFNERLGKNLNLVTSRRQDFFTTCWEKCHVCKEPNHENFIILLQFLGSSNSFSRN